jgi:transketolase C-terminal domain/subunit
VIIEERTVIDGLGGAEAERLSQLNPTWVVRIGMHDTYPRSGPNDPPLETRRLSAARAAK